MTPRELKTLIESLRRNFQLAKTNINGACEKLRKEIEKREEAGLHLVTLLTTLQEAELALGKYHFFQIFKFIGKITRFCTYFS